LTTGTFQVLKRLVSARTGIAIPEHKREILERRLRSRLQASGCASFEAYCRLLEQDPRRDEEWSALIDLITTNETSFYRDLAQLEAFTTAIVPALIQANRATSHIRLWSAACSTGEEPYTLAILLREQPALARWTIELLASDLSDTNLAVARRAVYSRYAVRNVPPAILRKYFRKEEGQYVLAEPIRRVVTFSRINLYDETQMRLVRGMDVVFCRNCLIYMDDEAKTRVITNLAACVRPGGYLVVGASESLRDRSDAFRPLYVNRAVIYQRVSG
jgi:chemotaxis protein methyltransferase CheR